MTESYLAPKPPDEEVIERGHENDEVGRKFVIFSTIGLIALMALALLVSGFIAPYLYRQGGGDPPAVVRSPQPSAGVRVTADQPGQLAELRALEEHQLNTYEWIVEQEGIARIPIQRAMEIIAENGLKTAQPPSEADNDNTN